jgi:outer membrane autotransporter protein
VPPPVTAEKPKPAPEELLIATEPVEPFWRGVSGWGAGEYEDLDRDRTRFEDGYDSDIWRVTVGADYQFTDRFVAGLAFDYYRHDGDFDGGGGFTNDSYGLLAYSTFLPMEQVYMQVFAGYARKDNERRRISSWDLNNILVTGGSIDSDYNGNEYQLGALAGYDFPINNVTISPRVGFDWRRLEYDSHKETGSAKEGSLIEDGDIQLGDPTGLELRFDDDGQTSLQTRIGVQTSVALRTNFGIVVPQASFDWMHEFKNNQRDVDVSFVEDLNKTRFTYETAKPERNWFEINAGVVTALPNGLQLFGNYRTIVGHSFFDSHAGTIGLRFSF